MSDFIGIPESLSELMTELARLPGIGPRSAERIAFHLLRASKEEAMKLAHSIENVKTQLCHCSRCFNLTDHDPCAICGNSTRDSSQIVVVEQPKDLMLLEQTGLIHGVYHVLMGHIAPLEHVGPEDLTIDALLDRVRAGGVQEVVLATNPNVEGDTTALYIHEQLKRTSVRISRLARGLAVGSQVEYASRAMLEAAITGRTAM